MKPARFVTFCFVYSGMVLLAEYVFVYQFQLDIAGIVQLGVALTILGTGLLRLSNPEKQEQKPTEYGVFAYGMAVFSVVLTALFLIELFAFK